MTKDEAKQILRNYNSWRRDNEGIEEQPNPKDIGIAIDIAISVLSQPESVQKPLSGMKILELAEEYRLNVVLSDAINFARAIEKHHGIGE